MGAGPGDFLGTTSGPGGFPRDPSRPQRPPRYDSGPRRPLEWAPGQAVAPTGTWRGPAAQHRRGHCSPWSCCGTEQAAQATGGSLNHPLRSLLSVAIVACGPLATAGPRAACGPGRPVGQGGQAPVGQSPGAVPERFVSLDLGLGCGLFAIRPGSGLPGAGQELPPATANARCTRRRQSPAPALSAGHVCSSEMRFS